MVVTHLVTIIPPNEQRLHWLATCSVGDFNKSYRNMVEARHAANIHINNEILMNALATGTYEFDDGSF